MKNILYIQVSPRGKRSKSIAVADAFIDSYKQTHPNDNVININIFTMKLPVFDGFVINAKYSILHGKSPSKEESEAWKDVEKIIEQFRSADKYVLAVPMWNFGIPYRLKHYIDILVQPGYTFSYDSQKGYDGLVKNKPMLIVYARGGEYLTDSKMTAFDLQKQYLELIFKFIGFSDIRSIIVEPTLAGGPEVAEAKLKKAIEAAGKMASDF